jgi:hypothetical protein
LYQPTLIHWFYGRNLKDLSLNDEKQLIFLVSSFWGKNLNTSLINFEPFVLAKPDVSQLLLSKHFSAKDKASSPLSFIRPHAKTNEKLLVSALQTGFCSTK